MPRAAGFHLYNGVTGAPFGVTERSHEERLAQDPSSGKCSMNSHINNKDDDNVPALSEEFVQHMWALREGQGLPGSHPGNELEVLCLDRTGTSTTTA